MSVAADGGDAAPYAAGNEASVGGTEYATLQDAVDASDGTLPVVLLRNVVLENDRVLIADLSAHGLTIDLNNRRIDMEFGGKIVFDGTYPVTVKNGMIYDNRGSKGTSLGETLPAVSVTGCSLSFNQVVLKGYAPSGSSGASGGTNFLLSVTSGGFDMDGNSDLSEFRESKGNLTAILATDSPVSVTSGTVHVNGTAIDARGACDITVSGSVDGGRGHGINHSGTGTVQILSGEVRGGVAVSVADGDVILGNGTNIIGSEYALEIGSACTHDVSLSGSVLLKADTAVMDRRTSGSLVVTGGRFMSEVSCISSGAEVNITGGIFLGPLDRSYLADGYVVDSSNEVKPGIKVVFIDSSGTRDPVYVPSGTEVMPPEPAVPVGKVFDCWMDSNDRKWEFVPLTEDTTYFAKYLPLKCFIEYRNHDGTVRDINRDLDYGVPVPVCDPGVRTGYTFSEWNTSPDGSGERLPEGATVSSDKVYYAVWKIDSYSVRFSDRGTETVIVLDYGERVQAPVPADVPAGYRFAGWNTVPDGSGTYLAEGDCAAGDITYYAVMEPLSYEVTFIRTSEPSDSRTYTMAYGTVIVPMDQGFVYGFHFIGWNTSEDGSGAYLAPDDEVSGDATYYAVWEADVFTVSFVNGDSVQKMELGYGDVIPSPEPVSKDGFRLLEWNSRSDGSGTVFKADAIPVSGDMSFYPIWEQVEFRIDFITDGQVYATYYRDVGENVPAPEDVPQKAGSVFVQWNTSSDGSGEAYAEGIVMGHENIKYFAVWGSYAEHDITFTDRGSVLARITKHTGDSLAGIMVDEPVRDGYKFVGWSSVLPNVMPDHSIVLDAVWQQDENRTVSGRAVYGDSLGTPLNGATVSIIKDGMTLRSVRTDSDGRYAIYDVPAGDYVLLCSKDGNSDVRWSGSVHVGAEDLIADIVIDIRGTSINVVSEHGAPFITVYGLESVAEDAYIRYSADSVSLRMLIDAAGSDSPEARAIAQIAGNRDLCYYDMSITMQIMKNGTSETVSVTDTDLLRIVMPFDMNGKDDLKLYRFHDGTAEAMYLVSDGAEAQDGTYSLEDGYVVIYSSSFSLYAVGYEGSLDMYAVVLTTAGTVVFLVLMMVYFSQWGVRVRK